MKTLKLILITAIVFFSCLCGHASPPPDHMAFDRLLKKHVSADGKVDYEGMVADSLLLNDYLNSLGAALPDDTWNSPEQMAYWINAYNASAIQLVVRHYPIASIRDIAKGMKKTHSIFDFEFILLGSEKFSLNEIENKLVKDFGEPKIYFVLNNATASAPNLRTEVYTADRLDAQLTEQLKNFLADTTKNKVTEPHAELSRIFQWHRGDFTKGTSFDGFISRYAPDIITFDTVVEFMEWDWGLNKIDN